MPAASGVGSRGTVNDDHILAAIPREPAEAVPETQSQWRSVRLLDGDCETERGRQVVKPEVIAMIDLLAGDRAMLPSTVADCGPSNYILRPTCWIKEQRPVCSASATSQLLEFLA